MFQETGSSATGSFVPEADLEEIPYSLWRTKLAKKFGTLWLFLEPSGEGSRWFQMVSDGSRWFQMVPDGPRWFQMVPGVPSVSLTFITVTLKGFFWRGVKNIP